MRSLIDIVDFSVEELQQLLDTACDIIENPDKYAESCKENACVPLLPWNTPMYPFIGNVWIKPASSRRMSEAWTT